MKRVIFILTVLFCSSIIILAQDKENNKEQKKEEKKEEKALIEKQIRINGQKLVTFSVKAKVDSLIDLYSPSCYYIMEYGKRIDGRDELQKKIVSEYKSGLKIADMSVVPDDIKIYNDMVLEVGVMTVKYINTPALVHNAEKCNYIILWKKSSDGKFRIRSMVKSPISYPCK